MKNFLFVLAFIFTTTLFLHSTPESTSLYDIKTDIIESCHLSPNSIEINNYAELVIILNYEEAENVELILENLPDWVKIQKGPYVRSFTTYTNGSNKKKVKITADLIFTKGGRLIIPPLTILAGNRKFETSSLLARVGVYEDDNFYIPHEIEWKANSGEVFLGEALTVTLFVKNYEEANVSGELITRLPLNGLFEKTEIFSDTRAKKVGNNHLYDVPLVSYIFTPTTMGSGIIPAAGIKNNNKTYWSNDIEILVKDIPDKIKGSGAIGNFSVSSQIDKKEIFIGEEITASFTVRGEGNFNFLQIPPPIVTNLLFSNSIVVKDYFYEGDGYSGSKTVYFTYKAKSSGLETLSIPEFCYLDKKTGGIISTRQKDYKINVKEIPSVNNSTLFNIDDYKKIAKPVFEWKDRYKPVASYFWLLPGVLFFILIRIFKKIKIRFIVLIVIASSIFVFLFCSFVFPGRDSDKSDVSSYSFYNDALSAYSRGELAQSLHSLRAAIYLNPHNKEYRKLLSKIEEENNLYHSIKPVISFHPDISYYFLVIVFNCVFLALSLKFLYKKSYYQILFIIFILLSVFSLSVLVYSNTLRDLKTAIITEKAGIKKIPQKTAGEWTTIDEGTAVRMLEQYDNYVLIKTNKNIYGWLKSDFLLKN